MIFNSLGISLKSFKNASAFLLRGARHAIAGHTSTAHIVLSYLFFISGILCYMEMLK